MTTPAQLPDSLGDRASLGSGRDFWSTRDIDGIPSIVLTDGPHGVRRQADGDDALGIAASLPATCFPPAVGLGQSWDPDLVERVARALGDESQALGVHVLLGPGINLKRSPLGGRNFEYYSEDPLVSGALGAAWIRGVQSRGVGASLKHFALNNQETDRMRVSADIDPRALHEVYLRGFRRAVQAQPWTVMCSYNRVNGVLLSENRSLLTTVLREQWDYRGVVVSDWGAVRDRVAAVRAGLDLQMPGDGGAGDAQVVAAVQAGDLPEADVNRAAERVAALARRAAAARRADAALDREDHHALAREAAGRSIVLLRNEGAVLPLAPTGRIAVIGEFARTPRYQGGGSSHVVPTRLDIPLDEIRDRAAGADVSFAPGFTVDGDPDAALLEEAVRVASGADVAVLFLGVAAAQESEGFDRADIELPADQLGLLERVAAVQPQVVVVLSHGGVLRLEPVVEHASAILDAALLGQGGGAAIADVLFGALNPSAKLTETVPRRLEDTPAFLDFPGELRHVRYSEGIFVGYRWYDARDLDVTYPFGHGLSYTTFAYSELQLRAHGDGLAVDVTVTNTGSRRGREVVQAYVSLSGSRMPRARRSLGGFAGIELDPGTAGTVRIEIDRSELEYWDEAAARFSLEGGRWQVAVGASSRDLRLQAELALESDEAIAPLTLESTMAEAMADPVASGLIAQAMQAGPVPLDGEMLGIDIAHMMAGIPIERLIGFSRGAVGRDQLQQLLDAANAARSGTDPRDAPPDPLTGPAPGPRQ